MRAGVAHRSISRPGRVPPPTCAGHLHAVVAFDLGVIGSPHPLAIEAGCVHATGGAGVDVIVCFTRSSIYIRHRGGDNIHTHARARTHTHAHAAVYTHTHTHTHTHVAGVAHGPETWVVEVETDAQCMRVIARDAPGWARKSTARGATARRGENGRPRLPSALFTQLSFQLARNGSKK
jgi:hypothetical protein